MILFPGGLRAGAESKPRASGDDPYDDRCALVSTP